MRAKVLSLALVAAIIALPVPAMQIAAPRPNAVPDMAMRVAPPAAGTLGLLLQDPFLIDGLSYAPPRSIAETAPGMDPHET